MQHKAVIQRLCKKLHCRLIEIEKEKNIPDWSKIRFFIDALYFHRHCTLPLPYAAL